MVDSELDVWLLSSAADTPVIVFSFQVLPLSLSEMLLVDCLIRHTTLMGFPGGLSPGSRDIRSTLTECFISRSTSITTVVFSQVCFYLLRVLLSVGACVPSCSLRVGVIPCAFLLIEVFCVGSIMFPALGFEILSTALCFSADFADGAPTTR